MWVDIANLMGPKGDPGNDGAPGKPGPINIGLNPNEPIVWDQTGGFTFQFVDGSEQTVNLPIASAQSAGLLGAGGQMPSTGRRNISDLMTGASGNVYVQRSGNIVELNIYGVSFPGEISSQLVSMFGTIGFPIGFRPTATFSSPLTSAVTVPDKFPIRLYMNNAGRCDATNPGASLYGQHIYLTRDSWPTVLPGSSA